DGRNDDRTARPRVRRPGLRGDSTDPRRDRRRVQPRHWGTVPLYAGAGTSATSRAVRIAAGAPEWI
ncbi:MAG: hypothetical protein AVDCRST_MAG68-2600, partial [uncultured Gemmatimonadetes bacterium]